MNPDWNYNFVDDNDLKNACSQFSQECRDVYDSFDLLHLKVDFGRYVILYLNGGIYADMDMYIFRPLDSSKYIKNIIKDADAFDNVIGVGKVNLNTVESFIFSSTSFSINNGYMISTPKNPILKKLIELIISKAKKYNNSGISSFDKMNLITGPTVINNFFHKNLKNRLCKIVLIPHYVFEPCTMDNICEITNDTVAMHIFASSWVDDGHKWFVKFYYKLKPYLLTIAIIAIFLIIIWFRK